MNKYLKYGIMGILAVTLSAILFKPHPKEEAVQSHRSYEEIVRSGVLRAVTEYNSVSFHVQADTLVGLHYDLLQAFAHEKGLKAEITPEMSMEKRTEGILNGTYDLLANNVLISSERDEPFLFTAPILLSRQMLIQRKDSTRINSLLGLARKTIHIVKGSPSILRIQNLSSEIGDTIYIEEVEKYGQEHLLDMVANGDIDYAVCDEGIARKTTHDLTLLDIETPISFSQFYSWGVHKENTIFLDSLNAWLNTYKKTDAFQKLMKKYTINNKKQ